MWPFALPQTKVVHLLRLAWVTVVVTVNQYKSRQGNASIQSGCKSQRYQAYGLRIQSEYVKGMDTNRLRYQAYWLRIQSESTVHSGSIRQTDRLCFNYDCRFGVVSAPWKPAMVL
jgi:hypothetical protein